MLNKNQEQTGGENSQNNQAGRDIIINGLSYSETKDLVKNEAQTVFKDNSVKLAEEAYKLVVSRSDELLDNFLEKLEKKNPKSIESMADPGMQYSLFNAQKEYARTGDKDLSELLEDILVERSGNPERNLMQIVLDECITVAPKLTPDQFDALSLIFLLRYTINYNNIDIRRFNGYFKRYIEPFLNGIQDNDSRYQHLEFTGCGTLGIGQIVPAKSNLSNYPVLFFKGFTQEEFEQRVDEPETIQKFLVPCHHDENKLQFASLNDDELEKLLRQNNIPEDNIHKCISLYEGYRMNQNEAHDYLVANVPGYKDFNEKWNNSSIRQMSLTSVGIAIAHANITRKIHERFNLNIWIK